MDFNCPLAVSSPATVVLSNSSVWLLVDYLNEYGKKEQFKAIDTIKTRVRCLAFLVSYYIMKIVPSICTCMFQLIMLRLLVFTMD